MMADRCRNCGLLVDSRTGMCPNGCEVVTISATVPNIEERLADLERRVANLENRNPDPLHGLRPGLYPGEK